jgi:Sulfotransferase domain
MRIAMWSGPRNLSTAMMYAFAARGDCAVVDEPLYAAYLSLTGIAHPMRDEILASQPTDATQAVAQISGPIPGDFPHFYQKHMTQHMVPGVPRDWMRQVKNVFLIRHPARVVASYAKKREAPTLDDIGFRQQANLFTECRAAGQTPLVIDSADIRADPGGMLAKLCTALGLDYRPSMLNWPAGGHLNDGVWSTHWYGAVHRSTGFAGAEAPLPDLVDSYADLAQQALPFYTALHTHRLT